MSTNLGRIDKYELQELLGRDGLTEVWKAFDTQARRYVAIKFLHANPQADPDFVARFQREMPAIAALRHPNIVQYYDFSVSQPPGTGNTTAYIVMNYVDGGTLADYIRNTSHQGKFPPACRYRSPLYTYRKCYRVCSPAWYGTRSTQADQYLAR